MVESARDQEAHHKIDSHEKVCAERYGNLWTAIQRIETTLTTHHASNDVRLTAMSNRMWMLLASGGGAAFVAVAVLAFYLMTKGMK